MNIWVISEGSPGHVSQSRGLADALGAIVPSSISTVEVREKGPGSLRGIYRTLFRSLPALRSFLAVFHCNIGVLPDDEPDVLIASGGRSVFAARCLADRFHAPLVYCGSPTPYPDNWFACVLTTRKEAASHPNWIKTDVLVNPVAPDIVSTAARQSDFFAAGKISTGRIGAVLVGGRSRSSRYEQTDWLQLAEQLNELATRDGWRWLIATSRRSGCEVELILKTNLNPDFILDAVWWSEDPRKIIRQYLGFADMVLVGRDSMTMVSESVCSGRPVIVYEPETTVYSALLEDFLDGLSQKKLVRCALCSDLATACSGELELEPFQNSPVPGYAESVVKLLNL